MSQAKRDVVFSLSYMQIVVIALAVGMLVVFSFLLGINVGKRQTPESVFSPVNTVTIPMAETGLEAETPAEVTPSDAEKTPLNFTKSLTDNKTTPIMNEPAPAKKAAVKPMAPQPKTESKQASRYEKYALQVASLTHQDAAEKFSHELSKKGFFTYVEEADLGSKGIFYRVYLGNFASKEEAKATQAKLKTKHNLDSMIVEK